MSVFCSRWCLTSSWSNKLISFNRWDPDVPQWGPAQNIGLRRESGIPFNDPGKLLAINPKCYHGKKWVIIINFYYNNKQFEIWIALTIPLRLLKPETEQTDLQERVSSLLNAFLSFFPRWHLSVRWKRDYFHIIQTICDEVGCRNMLNVHTF